MRRPICSSPESHGLRARPLALAALLACGLASAAPAEELKIDLAAKDAARDWLFQCVGFDGQVWTHNEFAGGQAAGKIDGGELVLDGHAATCRAIYLPRQWADVTLSAKFMVQPQAQGVLACGFMVRTAAADTFYYVHFDRAQAILVRSSPEQGWNEIKRVSGLDKPAGQWHEGKLQCQGDTLRVWLNGKLLYEAKDAELKAGRIGFYAGEGLARVKDIVVTGASQPAEKPLESPPPRVVRVATDAGAGAYEAFPDVCRLSDGRLMCVFYAGYGHVASPNAQWPKGGRVSFCTSSDEGRTWTAPAVLCDTDDDDRDPSIAQLADGRLLCSFFRPAKGTWIVASEDAGKTWSEPRQIAPEHYVSSPVRQLADGRLMLGLYYEKDGAARGAVIASADAGRTWGPVVEIPGGGRYLDAETDVIELADGRLLAALRGREEMCWSVSTDGGKTWSEAASFGRPGHCPYLHRTVEGVLLLAHRLPATSLSYSLDEGKTWKGPIKVDDCIGAYPSMVNLKDGSVLIVYYEEGAKSDIRARRFRMTAGGGQWLAPADEAVAAMPCRLVEVRKIWDQAPHNAFTGLVRFRDRWYCAFREGQDHVCPTGALRVLTSADGRQWTSAAHLTDPKADLRDASLSITSEGKLMLNGAAALHQPNPVRHQSMVWLSEDGAKWSEAIRVGEPNLWLWSVSWHKGEGYGVGYATVAPEFARLYKTGNGGKTFQPLVEKIYNDQFPAEAPPNESSLVFTEDGTCYGLFRRDERGAPGLLGVSKPPYTEWTWKVLNLRIGGPKLIRLPDARWVAAVRLYDGGVRTSLCWLDSEAGKLTECLKLPSGGDTSYPGMVWHDGLLWISYYSSHEGKTSIYLAKVAFDKVAK